MTTSNMSAAETVSGIESVLSQMLVDDSWLDHELWTHIAYLRDRVEQMEKDHGHLWSRHIPQDIDAILKHLAFIRITASNHYAKGDKHVKAAMAALHRDLKAVVTILRPFETMANRDWALQRAP